MTLRRMIKRLRLKPGDILLLRRDRFNSYDQIQQLIKAAKTAGINFSVPIVVVDGKHDVVVKRGD